MRANQAEKFEEMTGTAVEWQYYPFSDYLTNLQTSLTGSNPPDSVALSVLWLPQMGASGNVIDVESELDVDPDRFVEAGVQNASYDGTMYAVPWYVDCRLVAINLDMFEEAGLETPDPLTPPTWDQFSSWMSELSTDDRAGFIMDTEGYDCFLMSNGGSYLTDDGSEAALDSDEVIETAEFVNQEVNETGNMTIPTDREIIDVFLSGGAAMSYAGSWEYGRIDDAGFNWQYVPIPVGPSGDGSHSWSAGLYFTAPTATEYKDTVAEWFEMLLTDEEQMNAFGTGGFPAISSVYETEEFQSQLDEVSQLQTVSQEIENARAFPSHPEVSQMYDDVHTAIMRVVQEQSSPEEAMSDVTSQINGYL
jgi:multiple sugar transport system substrate-binding protein